MPMTLFREKELHHTGRQFEPAVSVTRNGYLRLNAPLVRRIGESWKYALIYWDEDGREVDLKLQMEDTEFARWLVKEIKGAWKINAKAFLRYAGIDPAKRQQYPAHYDESKQLIVFRVGER